MFIFIYFVLSEVWVYKYRTLKTVISLISVIVTIYFYYPYKDYFYIKVQEYKNHMSELVAEYEELKEITERKREELIQSKLGHNEFVLEPIVNANHHRQYRWTIQWS